MQLKTYQKVCLALIIVLISFKYAPIIYGKINPGSRVKPGQVWCATLYNTIDMQPYEHMVTQITYRKVLAVEDGNVIYVIQNDTTKYIDDINSFTFNGSGYQSHVVQESNN